MNVELLFSFLTASMLLTFMPGPDIIYVLMQSVTNGKKYGIATSAGLVTGIIIHTALIAVGVSTLIKQSTIIFTGIKVFGAVYLFYLAYMSYRSSSAIDLEAAEAIKKPVMGLYKQGFIMNVLNPKVTIFFLAFFPGFIDESLENTTAQIIVLGLIFMLQAFLIFSLIAVLSDKLTEFLRTSTKFSKSLKWFQVLVFLGIGVFILLGEA